MSYVLLKTYKSETLDPLNSDCDYIWRLGSLGRAIKLKLGHCGGREGASPI